MARSFTLVAAAALLAGCSGTATAPTSFFATGAQSQSRSVAPNQNCPSASGGSGILSDGDFSQAPYPGPHQTFGKGQSPAPDWIVTLRSVDLAGSDYITPGSVCSVDLDGSSDPAVGAIAHSPVATTSGTHYTVSFLLSGNHSCQHQPTYRRGPRIKKMVVEAAGQSSPVFTFDTAKGHDAQHGFFNQETWSFTASSQSTTLTLKSLDRPIGSWCGPVIAIISLTQN
jgi:hypothetical protein